VGAHWFRFIVEEGPNFHLINSTSPMFHVLTGTGKTATHKLCTVQIARDTTEEVIILLDKYGCSEASVDHVTCKEHYKDKYCFSLTVV
jgi:hypothetical protein